MKYGNKLSIILPMIQYWIKYKERVLNNCLHHLHEEDGLAYWRNKLFATIMCYLLPLGIIITIASIPIVIMAGQSFLAFFYLFAITAVAFVALRRKMNIYHRKVLFLSIIYLVAITLLYYMGSYGASLTYLFAITVFALLILSQKAGFWTVAINALICIVYAAMIHSGYADYPLRETNAAASWLAVSSNSILLSIVAAALLPMLFQGLQNTIEKQRKLDRRLRENQTQLENSLASLKEKNKEIQLANKRYNVISQITNEVIWEWNIETDFHFWSGHNTDLIRENSQSENLSLNSWFDKIHPKDVERVKKSFFDTINSNDEIKWEEEYRFLRKDGTYANVYDRGYVIRNEEDKAVQFLGGMQDISKIKETELIIRNSLKEKETLLSEIHHRVKNNLAVISSMLQLQSFQEDNKELTDKLTDSIMRIKSIANIHEQLYESKSFSNMEFGDNLKKLIGTIIQTIQTRTKLQLQYNLDSITLNVQQAVPCSLIVNEVMTNILKHAYPDSKTGMVKIHLAEINGNIKLWITDDGVGLPENFNPKELSSLGIQLIQTLTQQLEGSYRYRSSIENVGTEFHLQFEKTEPKGIDE